MTQYHIYDYSEVAADECVPYESIKPKMGSEFKLARAYVRYQSFGKIFDPIKGLMRGTIFPELYESYTKKKRNCECEGREE